MAETVTEAGATVTESGATVMESATTVTESGATVTGPVTESGVMSSGSKTSRRDC